MRTAQVAILVLGLGLAGYGVYTAQSYITESQNALAMAAAQRQSAPPPIETIDVLVAAQPLRYGEQVTADAVRSVAWPASALPEGVYRSVDALVPDPERPRVALRAMEPNEPIMSVKVSNPGQQAGIAAMLSPGMRAFTIRVDARSGISGTMRPGVMVDLYWSGRGDGGDVTRLLFSAIRVIALDENADQDRNFSGVPRSLTIEAPPEVVATIAQAEASGRLSMSVVGLDDQRDLGRIEVDRRSVLGVEAPQAVEAQQRCTIRTRRGSEVVTMEIPCTN